MGTPDFYGAPGLIWDPLDYLEPFETPGTYLGPWFYELHFIAKKMKYQTINDFFCVNILSFTDGELITDIARLFQK